MWMNGSSRARSTPANARRTGNPSPSNPDGAVVTEVTARSAWVTSGSGTRGRTRMFSTVIAGISPPTSIGLSITTFENSIIPNGPWYLPPAPVPRPGRVLTVVCLHGPQPGQSAAAGSGGYGPAAAGG